MFSFRIVHKSSVFRVFDDFAHFIQIQFTTQRTITLQFILNSLSADAFGFVVVADKIMFHSVPARKTDRKCLYRTYGISSLCDQRNYNIKLKRLSKQKSDRQWPHSLAFTYKYIITVDYKKWQNKYTEAFALNLKGFFFLFNIFSHFFSLISNVLVCD